MAGGGADAPRGFGSREDASAAREAAKAALRKGADPSLRLTVEAYLTDWLAGRVDLKPTTRRNYSITIGTYLVPLLGHLQLGDLDTGDIAEAFATIRDWNASLAEGEPVRPFQRFVGPAAMQRIRAVLRAALNDAERDGKIEYNPASRVRMEPGRTTRPTIWTPERISKFWAAHGRALVESPGGRG